MGTLVLNSLRNEVYDQSRSKSCSPLSSQMHKLFNSKIHHPHHQLTSPTTNRNWATNWSPYESNAPCPPNKPHPSQFAQSGNTSTCTEKHPYRRCNRSSNYNSNSPPGSGVCKHPDLLQSVLKRTKPLQCELDRLFVLTGSRVNREGLTCCPITSACRSDRS